jgi:hypothetical protein
MPRSRWFLVGLAAVAAAGAAAAPPAARGPAGMAVAGAPVVVGMVPADVPDPFPIARIRVTEARLADAAKAFAPGPLVRLPRPVFESKVRAAGEAARAARAAPHLVEARYAAAPSGAALAGTAEWTVTHAGPGPAVLPLDPLRLALRDAAWADGSPAAVGAFAELPAGGVGVWVPGPGRHVLRAKWTAAGTGPAAERTFDLKLPPCPASVLDLDLADDRTPTAGSADVLVTGPLPGAPPGRRRWRLRLGEKARAEVAVRGPAEAGGGGPVVYAAAARYDLTPAEAACEFDFDLRAARGAAAEWAFALSPGLRVTDVTVNNRTGWRVDPASGELRVALRQPVAAAKVRVSAVAALPAGPGAPAPLPAVRPVNGLPADERAEVRLAPGLDLAAWEPGDYRLADAAPAPDGGRVLTLVGTLLPADRTPPVRHPPAVRAGAGGPVFATSESVTWRVEAGRTHLTARVGVKVRRGPLFGLTVRPPAAFNLDRAAATPADLIAFTGPGAGRAVAVEFARPLLDGQEAEVAFEFRGPPVPAGPVARLPFPAVGVSGAAERDGRVSLTPGPGWEAFPHVLPDPARPADPPDDPAGATVVRYRGPEPAGELVLSAVRPAFNSSVETHFDSAGGRWTVTSAVQLDVTAGMIGGVAVFEPGPADPARTWKVADGSNTVASATPARLGELPAALGLLGRTGGGLGPVAAAAAAMREEPGTLWLVRFSRPVEDGLTLETTAGLAADPAEAASRSADWTAGRYGLVVRGAAARVTRTVGAPFSGQPAARPADAAPADWVVSDRSVVTACSESDQTVAFGGVVVVRAGRELPVRLPAGAVARSASVGGVAVAPAGLAAADLRLPVPAGDTPVPFEVRYQLGRERRGVGWAVTSPVPDVPGAAGGVRRGWLFAAGVSAAWPSAVRAAPASESDGAAWSDDPAAAVTVVPDRLAAAAGVGLAALAAGLGWAGARAASRSAGLALLAVLAGAGVATAAGPPAWVRVGTPVVAVGLPAALAVVVARGRLRRPLPAAAGLVLLAAVAAPAQTGAPEVVFVVVGPDGEVVYAPPALLARLDARPAAPAPVVVAAAYDGRAEDGLARVTAQFAVQAFGPGEQAVVLPLADVRLERVTVAGRPASPTAAGPGRYAVTLPGPGRHAVEARFAVPVGVTGAEREVKFGVPEVPDARLAFATPPAGRQPQAVGRFGEQKAAPGAGRVEAELGAARAVTVRWREGPAGAGRLAVREGCVWDVSEAGAVLTACYDVRAESGTAAGFRFDLPPGLEPVRVAARGLDAAAGPVSVQGWAVGAEKGGARTLRVDLAAPADGRVLVTVECHTAPTRRPVLRFPRPVGMDRLGGVYGLRAAGVAVEAVGRSGVIDFAADAMTREFGAVTELRLVPAGAVQAFSLQPGESPELRPVLRPGPDAGTAAVEATWAAGPRGASGAGAVRWSAEAPAALLEFSLAAHVREVRGADVAGWGRVGERVQVWFRRAVKDATVEWAADLTHHPDGTAGDAVGFEPPLPRTVGAAAGPAVVRVRPADGVGLRVERAAGWAAAPDGAGREWAFRAPGAAPPVRVLLAATRAGRAAGLGLLDPRAPDPAYRLSLDLPVGHGRPAHAVVRVTDLPPGAVASLEPPAGGQASARDGDDDEKVWDVDVPTAAGPVRVVAVVRLPAGWVGPLPRAWVGPGGDVPDPGGVVRFAGLVGRPAVQLTGVTAASPVEQAEAGATWPGEVERLRRTGGRLWTVGETGVVLESPPAEPPAPPAPRPAPNAAPAPPPQPPAVAAPPPGSAAAAGWGVVVVLVGLLFARFPRATWPEQAAALAGLFGHALAGGPGVGLVVYVAARGMWLADRLGITSRK